LILADGHCSISSEIVGRQIVAKLAHSNIRVIDEQRSIDFYRRAFDLEPVDRALFDDFTLVFLGSPESEFEVELTINHGRTEPYTHGTGYGHLAVSVEDLDGEHAKCARLGLNPTPIRDLHSQGRLAVRFFFVIDPDGYKVAVVRRHSRYR
jgi:lactoylglutathione lyase